MIRRFLLIFATLSILPVQGSAQPANQGSPVAEQLLQQAEKFYESLEYEPALQMLIKVHQVQGASPMQRARSFLYMGVCFTALGRAEDAVQSFVELLKIKPEFRLPAEVSPSIKAMFGEALSRQKLPKTPPPQQGQDGSGGSPGAIPVAVKARAPIKVTAGNPIEVKINVTDPKGHVQKLLVRWRLLGGPDFSTVSKSVKPGSGQTTVNIPGATLAQKKGKVVFFVEALGKGDMTLAHSGSMDAPLKVQLTLPSSTSSNWGWWTLGIGGALVVAGGIVAAVMLTRDDGGPVTLPNTADATVIIK